MSGLSALSSSSSAPELSSFFSRSKFYERSVTKWHQYKFVLVKTAHTQQQGLAYIFHMNKNEFLIKRKIVLGVYERISLNNADSE